MGIRKQFERKDVKIQKGIFYLGKIVFLAALCVGCSRPFASDSMQSNDPSQENYPIVPFQEVQIPSWEDYVKLYSISESEISTISIEYHYLGWEKIDRSYVIEASGGRYRTEDGKSIRKSKIVDFAAAMVNLRRSAGLKTCINHTDDYPEFRVEIQYASGQKAILYSTSNCNQQRVPWNIVYGDALYFQSTGEISEALYKLMDSFVVDLDEWWQPSLNATTYMGGGSNIHINSHYLPPEIKSVQFSEEEIFRQILIESGELDDHLTNYDLEAIELYCEMFSTCTLVDAEVKLKGQAGTLFIVDAHFDNSHVLQVEHVATASELMEIGNDIETSNLIRQARNAKQDLAITVHCRMQAQCGDLSWCSTSYGSVQKDSPPENLVCSVDFILGYVTSLVYLPVHEQFWVRQLLYDFYESPSSQWKLELDPVLELFRIPGFEKIADDMGKGLFIFSDEDECNSITLRLDHDKVDAIEAMNPDYIDNYANLLKKDLQSHDVSEFNETIKILGSCLFVNPDGDFSYVQP